MDLCFFNSLSHLVYINFSMSFTVRHRDHVYYLTKSIILGSSLSTNPPSMGPEHEIYTHDKERLTNDLSYAEILPPHKLQNSPFTGIAEPCSVCHFLSLEVGL